MPTIAENLAEYATTLKFEDLPAEVVHNTKRIIMDTLGCAFGGFGSEPATMARELAADITSRQPATIFCSGQQTSLDLAVFVNGIMIRYLDFNDGYISKGSGHPSDSIGALLSSAEIAHAGGRELIVATVIAYEIFCRLCDVLENKQLGFDHVVMGGIGSVAGASRLLGLNREQTIEAINLTVTPYVALNQTRVENVSKWKACGYANANRNAVFAAQLAKRGMTGPGPAFEGRDAFFRVVSRKPFELAPFGGSGRPFKIMECSTKRYPLGQYSQTVVQAALDMRALIGDVRNVADVHVSTLQTGLNSMAGDPQKWRPANRETADHSIPYTAAVALMYGTVNHHHFDPEHLRNAELLDLVSRIRCSASEEANRREAEMNLCDFDVTLRSGERKSVRCEYHRGHWRNPMKDAEMEEKFRALAAELLPRERVEALVAQLWKLDALPDVGTLLTMTRI